MNIFLDPNLWFSSNYLLAAFLTFSISFLFALIGMEVIAWASHKWVMHGFLWVLHSDHHIRNEKSPWEKNDLFGVFFSFISIALIWGSLYLAPFWKFIGMGLGLGMTGYGLGYFIFHDLIAHSRMGKLRIPDNAYLRKLISVHRIHHSVFTKHGAKNFGFLWAPNRIPVESSRESRMDSNMKSKR